MLPVTRWFIKSGLLYLVAGIMLLLIDSFPLADAGVYLLPIYWHMIAVGWITQVIMGVSVWMFPRHKKDRKKQDSLLAWAVFWTLNTGLFLRFLSEPFIDLAAEGDWPKWLAAAAVALQLGAAILYFLEIWPRIQPKRNRKTQKTTF